MTNKIILETIPILFLYDIIHILNLVINLYYLNNCMIKGLRLYKIFFYVDGHFLCDVVFQQLYNLDDFCIMKYNSVISAISKYLKLLSIDTGPWQGISNGGCKIIGRGVWEPQ